MPGTRSGFTAVELLTVLAIVGILAALATPSMQYLIERWRVRNGQEALISALHLARSEAIKRGGNVVLQKIPLTANCTHPGHSGTRDWSCGWLIYADANDNGAFNSGDTRIQEFPAPEKINVETYPGNAKLTFNRWGRPGQSSMRFTISPASEPDSTKSPATASVCMSSGLRIRYQSGPECTP